MDSTAPAAHSFAGFELVKELNRGSLGSLFLARSPGGDPVLLRVVAETLDGWDRLRERVERDLDRLQEVDHPNVARPVDRGVHDGQFFYALSYPGTTTLLQLVQKRRPLAGRELVWLGRGVAAGIASLHKAGLPHGDLWPGKIAITEDGPVIVELGWGRRFRQPGRNSGPADFASDWRGLGASLVYAATGHLPASDGSGLGALVPPASWDAELVGFPRALAELVDSLLAPASERPSLDEITRAFAEAKAVPASELADLFGAASQVDSFHETTEVPPVDSEEAMLCEIEMDDLPTQTVDAAARFSSSRSSFRPPPKTHVLRDGFELPHKRILGKGGMGIVHLVLDPDLGRHAALKLIRGKASETRVSRFLRETKVTARLDHPGVPPVYETGTAPDGQVYMLMQYVEGVPLSSLLEGRRTAKVRDEPRELLRALVKVAETVAYAHSRRIVHRDLKPPNIMLGSFGEVFVMDWGLARDLLETSEEDVATHSGHGSLHIPSDGSNITQEGAVLGTPGYIPPEQARGDDVDVRADVFALGAVLTEMLTGRPPVTGESIIEVLELTRAGHIEAPRQRDMEISPELDAIARGATSMDREERYPTAHAFAKDLRAYLDGQNVSTYSYRPRERVLRFVRRHPTLMASLFIAALLSIVGAVQVKRARAETLAKQHRQCTALIVKGRASLAEGRAAEAGYHFAQALALEPTNPEAVIGQHDAQAREASALAEELKRKRIELAREQIQALLEEGELALGAGDLERARRSFEQALALEGAPETAEKGLLRAKTLLAEREAHERIRGQEARDAALALRYVKEGKDLLFGKKKNYEKARVALIKAVAFGSDEARSLLLKNEELLLERRLRDRQRARARRDAREAQRLVIKAKKAAGKGDLPGAKAAYLQALAFRGGSRDAQRGLVQVDRALQKRQSLRDREKNLLRAGALRKKAKTYMAQGRSPPDSDQRDARALEAYFAALVAYDRALAFAPEQKTIRAEKLQAVREVATFLRERGHLEFAEFLLRYGGVKSDDGEATEDEDATLVFQEADQVTLRSAFGGRVRFAPTRAFPKLREYLHSLKGRYKVRIQIRSRATSSNPPKVSATGLWVRVEDTLKGTVYPMVKIQFEGGPYPRTVRVSAGGREIGPFEKAHSLDVQAQERRVIAEIRRLVGAG